jgi:hypothetical protein
MTSGDTNTILAAVAGVAFSIWMVATILYQFDKPSLYLSRFDVFRLLPRWTFFSPNPGQHDMHLLYRDRLQSEALTDWYEVDFIGTPAAIPILWNPEKRLAKVLWDCWAAIQHFSKLDGYAPLYLALSGAYLVLLNIAQRAPSFETSIERQFALVRSRGFVDREIEPLFVSGFHALADPKTFVGPLCDELAA